MSFADLKKDTDIACLRHCDFGNEKRYSAMLRNINNHLSACDFDPLKIRIVFVAHSARDAPYVRMVPSGIGTVGALQARGYACLRVGQTTPGTAASSHRRATDAPDGFILARQAKAGAL